LGKTTNRRRVEVPNLRRESIKVRLVKEENRGCVGSQGSEIYWVLSEQKNGDEVCEYIRTRGGCVQVQTVMPGKLCHGRIPDEGKKGAQSSFRENERGKKKRAGTKWQ